MDTEQIKKQIEEYIKVHPRYELYASVLQQVLEQAVKKYAHFAIVQSRAKTIGSFAEKIQRKKDTHHDPLRNFTDLCGARIVTLMAEGIRPVCQFIEKNFAIDWENSVDITQRRKPSEFGYRSVHYVIQFKHGAFPAQMADIELPDEVFPDEKNRIPMKAEIQVRTILEHAWAVFTHDRTYKSAFGIPASWSRELAGVAAMLEEADRVFSRIKDRLQTYSASYGTYMTTEQIQQEIKILELVLKYEKDNLELVHRIGTLAITIGDWSKAVDVLAPYNDSGHKPILRNLGFAMCKLYGDKPGFEAAYLSGQQYLEAAGDPDALATLASTWKDIDDQKAKAIYKRACERDPADPYPLQNYLMYEIVERKDASLVNLLTTTIDTVLRRCRDHADVGVNIPWVYFNMGNFLLLTNKHYESLSAYAKAIDCSVHDWMIETTLRFVGKLAVVKEQLLGYEWAHQLLLLGRAAKFQTPEAVEGIRRLVSDANTPLTLPIVIIAGECNHTTSQADALYQKLLLKAFENFIGTIISGGTTAGVSGFVGDIQEAFPKNISTIGYLPKQMTHTVVPDKRYREIRHTGGEGFSAYEPLQYWTDIIASGIRPDQVKLIGIGGGTISAFEYRMALAFGAQVAVSGEEAVKLVLDPDWVGARNFITLPPDPMTFGAFIGPGVSGFSPEVREIVARAIHENYRLERTAEGYSQDPAMANWDKLREDFKNSNLQQADHIFEKLLQFDYTVKEVKGRPIKPLSFSEQEVEVMAEMEHGRWVVERLQRGWKFGSKKDTANKISPYLIPWSELSEEVKKWDRQAVRKIPELLAQAGIEIIKK